MLGKTGWKVVLEDLSHQAMEKIQVLLAATTSTCGVDLVFRGLTDFDLKDLMQMCEEQHVDLFHWWDDVKEDVFWIAKLIQTWNLQCAKAMRSTSLMLCFILFAHVWLSISVNSSLH